MLASADESDSNSGRGSSGEREVSSKMVNGDGRFGRRRFLVTAGYGAAALCGATAPRTAASDHWTGDVRWTFETEGLVRSSPTVVDGIVYVGSADTRLYALEAATGDEIWSADVGSNVSASPTVVDGTAFVGSRAGTVSAFDATTGETAWTAEIDGSITASSPTVGDGLVYCGSWDGTVYALETASGREAWTYDTGAAVRRSSPTVVDGTVYIGSSDGALYALAAETGEEAWTFETGGDIRSSPTVVDGSVYVGSFDRSLYAVDAATGDQRWAVETGRHIGDSSPTVVDETVYVGGYDRHVYALEATTGETEWTYETSATIESSPTVADGILYVGDSSPRGAANVYALDALRGHLVWSYGTNGPVLSSPTVVDGTVYVGSYDHGIYALDAGTDGSSEGSRVLLGTLGHHGDVSRGDAVSPPTYDRSLLADFAVDPSAPRVGEPVEFDASASAATESEIRAYRWDFTGDETTDRTGPVLERAFETPGTRQVSLTVVDERGNEDTVRRAVPVAPPEGELAVRIARIDDAVEGGETIDFAVELENGAETARRPEVRFFVDGDPQGSFATTVDPGTETFDWNTRHTAPVRRAETVTVGVEIDGDSDERTVEVRSPDEFDAQYADPDRELTVRPDAAILFEVDGELFDSPTDLHWFVDGEYVSNQLGPWPGTYHAEVGREYFSYAFETAGAHEVAAAVVREGSVVATYWEVAVTETGAAPPTIETGRPVADELAVDEPYALELEVSSRDTDLDRVVWWLTQADAILDVTPISGDSDTASIEIDGGCHTCRIHAWVITETNVYATVSPWEFDGFDAGGSGVDGATETDVSAMIFDTSGPVSAGERLEVVALLENRTSEAVTKELEFAVGDEYDVVETRSVRIPAGETERVTLTHETDPETAGSGLPVRVAVDGREDERTVFVEE